MFNLFNKKKEENPISDMFSGLTTNQKMSVFNLLLTIGVCDVGQGNQDKELQFLNTYIRLFDIHGDRCMAYLQSYGYERITNDLVSLSKDQKELLVVAAWDMIICDGKPNDTEIQVAGSMFEKIGVSEEQFFATIQKTQALMKHFYGK